MTDQRESQTQQAPTQSPSVDTSAAQPQRQGSRAGLAILIILGFGALDYMAHHPKWLLLLLIPLAWVAYQLWIGWRRAQTDLEAVLPPRRTPEEDEPSTWE